MGDEVSKSQDQYDEVFPPGEDQYDEVDRPGNDQYDIVDRPGNDQYDIVDRPGNDQYDIVDRPYDEKHGTDKTIIFDEVPHANHVKIANENNETADEINLRNDEDSLTMFREKYDDLDETDSPYPDPGSDPDSVLSETDFPFRKSSKTKACVRSQLYCEGITSTHTTYFPKKLLKDAVDGELKRDINSDYYYEMNSFPRGTLTLLNVQHFRKSTGMADAPRNGTDRDAEGLCSLFLDLGFIVERYDNPTKKAMLGALDVAASNETLSCQACAVLTHGEEGIIYASDSGINIKDLTKRFRRVNLAGKPKLFLFQACQGSDYMDAIDATDAPPEENDIRLPSEADFLFAYSTVSGYYSWRNSRQGSWFMQAICSIFRQYAHSMDVGRMLTRVNDAISSRKSRTDDVATDDKRQIASIVSQMRKDLFLFPPYGPLISSHK